MEERGETTTQDPEPVAAAEEEAPPNQESSEQDAPSIELPYTVGEWGGKPNYQCRLCDQYAALGMDQLMNHLRERHGIGQTAAQTRSLILGPDGQPLGG